MVDLETTGGSAEAGSMITEIGAVKVRGGEVLGEFQTLVNPHTAIPPFIAVLTGISNAMVVRRAADRVGAAGVPRVRGRHRAGRPQRAVRRRVPAPLQRAQGRAWPAFEVVDTAKLARRVITRDDAPNCKLSSLARVFRSTTTPNHRALSDARATVDVLHGLMERLGGLGVHTLEELQTFSARVSTAQRRKRHLAEGLPHSPGVYLFCDDARRVLYVGTSRDLRTRVRSYFTASETRSRMGEMVGLATTVEGIVCSTALEAQVRELRLIAEHKPRYNRRSRFPERMHFVKLTREPWPRLSLVTKVLADDADYLGPFGSRKVAEKCLAALHDTFPVRQCSDRFGKVPSRTPCVLAELGRCLSPCDGSVDATTYASVVRLLQDTLLRRPDEVVEAINRRMAALADDERFEEAGVHRDRLAAFVRAAARTQRLTALSRCPEIVATRREDDGRWAVHVVRHGRLAAAGVIPPGADAHQYVAELRLCAETVGDAPGPVPAATRRGVREGAALAGVRGRPPRRRRGRVELPGRRRQPPPRRPRRGRRVPAHAWSRSPTAATSTTVHQPAR